MCGAVAIALPAQTFTPLASFDAADGAEPVSGLIQATNGDFYGTTPEGGDGNHGAIFKITPTGTLTALYEFCSLGYPCTDGAFPYAGLIQAANGDFYGTTEEGGANNYAGTVFKITPSGKLTTIYSFCSQAGCTDGQYPKAGLVQAADGDFYGTTYEGGTGGSGTVFKITPSGVLTTLYTFCPTEENCTDGQGPNGLIQATNGEFYGTTESGGASCCVGGTVFRITPSGTLTTVYTFCSVSSGLYSCADGETPTAGLVQATNGEPVFYGTTSGGGASTGCEGCGTVFEISGDNKLTTLYSFCSQANCTDGSEPMAGVIQATDGALYGTTYGGGANGFGTIFKVTPGVAMTTLYNFNQYPDGANPAGALVQATNGTFYGTTERGGISVDEGSVFSLSVGLGPFVEPQTTSGKVGAAVKILGTDLKGATSVTFNGTTAVFEVKSRSLITTTVPAGATTGNVVVVTPSRTLSSNVPFRVP
jgi:uncharacterized repeat protein (TIGR03803 family)